MLRSLTLGTEDSPCQMGGVHHVLAACPRLEKLVIHGDAVSWSALQGPVLTTLEHHGDLTVESVKAFAQLPSLTSLTLDEFKLKQLGIAVVLGLPTIVAFFGIISWFQRRS